MKPKFNPLFSCLVAIGFALAMLSQVAQGQLFWSGNGSTQGDAGTWDTTNARWGKSTQNQTSPHG